MGLIGEFYGATINELEVKGLAAVNSVRRVKRRLRH